MNKKTFYFFVILVTIISVFILSSGVVNATTVEVRRICHNGPSNTDSGGCGIACVGLCKDNSFIDLVGRPDCIALMRNETGSWTKYGAISFRDTITPPCY